MNRIALIGFGEVGQRLATDLGAAGVPDIRAWDLAFADPRSGPSMALGRVPARRMSSAKAAAQDADLVISAVTAAQTLRAARSAVAGLKPGGFFLDLNSASPARKLKAGLAVAGAGSSYVEAAVMSPIEPHGAASPMLLGGPAARAFLEAAGPLGFTGARVFSDVLGKASAAKLCRSVMIKGLEALLTESLLTARRYGVEDEVLDSLSDLLPLPDWPATARYMISRSLTHGARRAEEMREAAATVRHAQAPALMSGAIARRQARSAAFGHAASLDLAALLDSIDSITGTRG